MLNNPNVSRDALTRALATAADHCRPILLAVRDFGCGHAVISQDAGPFVFPMDKPTVVVVGDDMRVSKGPSAFDAWSLHPVIRQCAAAFVIASAAEVTTYSRAVTWSTVLRKNVLIVETRPKHEEEWTGLLLRIAPHLVITVSKVDPLAGPVTRAWGHA